MNTTRNRGAETTIFFKTSRGKQEIVDRNDRLPTNLRTLLLLINGERTVGELMELLQGLNYEQRHFYELVAGGYITDGFSDVDPEQQSVLDDTVEMSVDAEALLEEEEEQMDDRSPSSDLDK